MELDDLKTAWQSLDRRLEQVYASELRTLRQQHLGKVRRHVRLLTAGRIIQLLAGVALTLFMGDFWISHLDQPHLLICGVLLHVYGIMLIISSAREFYLINNLHYDSPVVLIQRKLAELRRWHLTEAYVFGVTGCFIWVPMVLVAFQLLFGADVYLNAPDVVWDYLASALVLALGGLGIRYWLGHSARAVTAARITNHLVGKTVARAESVVAEIARFEQDI